MTHWRAKLGFATLSIAVLLLLMLWPSLSSRQAHKGSSLSVPPSSQGTLPDTWPWLKTSDNDYYLLSRRNGQERVCWMRSDWLVDFAIPNGLLLRPSFNPLSGIGPILISWLRVGLEGDGYPDLPCYTFDFLIADVGDLEPFLDKERERGGSVEHSILGGKAVTIVRGSRGTYEVITDDVDRNGNALRIHLAPPLDKAISGCSLDQSEVNDTLEDLISSIAFPKSPRQCF